MITVAETFEEGWGRGNHGSIDIFIAEYLHPGLFDDGGSATETFTYAWKQPHIEGYFTVGGGEGAAFTPGQQIYDKTGRGTAFVKSVATDTVTVILVKTNTATGLDFATLGATLTARGEGYILLGTGNGTTKQFGGTLTTPVLPYQTRISVVIGGVTYVLTDNGVGSLISVDGKINTSLTHTIDYATGVVNFTLTEPPDADTQVTAVWFAGADLGTVVSAFTQASASPYNHSAKIQFTLGDTATLGAEDFESDWSTNQDYVVDWSSVTAGIGLFDASTEGHENFENLWRDNEDAQDSFSGGDLLAGTFDVAADAFEDFQSEWSTTLQF